MLVATPGRLLDLIGQGHIDLRNVEFFVLDEADQMLDMGFIRDIKKVLNLLPRKRQNLLFSATMPKSIAELADSFLNNAIKVDVSPKEITVDRIAQKIMFVKKADKRRLLVEIIKQEKVRKAIVFTRTKHGANRLVKQLGQSRIDAAAIHGNKSQSARTKALESFKTGETKILVATDIASRGIDVDNITHVFNYDLPNEPESYVHRIGRTARAGKSGVAYGFCDDTESGYLVGIQQLIGFDIDVDESHEYHFKGAIPKPDQNLEKSKQAQLVAKTVIQTAIRIEIRTITKIRIEIQVKPRVEIQAIKARIAIIRDITSLNKAIKNQEMGTRIGNELQRVHTTEIGPLTRKIDFYCQEFTLILVSITPLLCFLNTLKSTAKYGINNIRLELRNDT